MTDHTLAVRRRATVKHTTCPVCFAIPNVRCVDEEMNPVVPHPERLALGDIWFDGYDQAAATVNRLEAEIVVLEESVEALTAEASSAEADLQECKSARAAAEAQVSDLTRRVTEAADDIASLQTQLKASEALLAASRSALSAAQAEIKRLQAIIDAQQPTPPPTPNPNPRLLIGAAYYNNISKPDGVEAAAGVPYDAVRIYAKDGSVAQRDLMVSLIKKASERGNKNVIVSFKLPASWATMASGSQDAWIKATAKAMSDAAELYRVRIWLIFHHEPENDTGTNNGGSDTGRDQWKAMQSHIGKLVQGVYPLVLFGACLMGYHSQSKASSYPRWKLENCIPAADVDFVMFDLYEDSTNVPVVYKMLADYCNPKGLAHGLGEYGAKKADFTADPTCFNKTVAAMKATGGSILAYYNTQATNTSNPNPDTSYFIGTSGPRFDEWVKILRNKNAA